MVGGKPYLEVGLLPPLPRVVILGCGMSAGVAAGAGARLFRLSDLGRDGVLRFPPVFAGGAGATGAGALSGASPSESWSESAASSGSLPGCEPLAGMGRLRMTWDSVT